MCLVELKGKNTWIRYETERSVDGRSRSLHNDIDWIYLSRLQGDSFQFSIFPYELLMFYSLHSAPSWESQSDNLIGMYAYTVARFLPPEPMRFYSSLFPLCHPYAILFSTRVNSTIYSHSLPLSFLLRRLYFLLGYVRFSFLVPSRVSVPVRSLCFSVYGFKVQQNLLIVMLW